MLVPKDPSLAHGSPSPHSLPELPQGDPNLRATVLLRVPGSVSSPGWMSPPCKPASFPVSRTWCQHLNPEAETSITTSALHIQGTPPGPIPPNLVVTVVQGNSIWHCTFELENPAVLRCKFLNYSVEPQEELFFQVRGGQQDRSRASAVSQVSALRGDSLSSPQVSSLLLVFKLKSMEETVFPVGLPVSCLVCSHYS